MLFLGLEVSYSILFAQDTVRILFIGNSYTFANTGVNSPELPLRLQEMGSLYGKTIIADFTGSGGTTLEKLWKSGKAAERIRNGNYHYVVVQEHSLGTIRNIAKFENYTRKFYEVITQNQAVPVLYMTWARKNHPGMIDTISGEYIRMAGLLDIPVAPCGFAWDMTGSQYPAIPLYWNDNSHPRPEGVLLNAYVFYYTLFGEIPDDKVYTFSFKETVITEDTAKKLSAMAHRANLELEYQIGRNK